MQALPHSSGTHYCEHEEATIDRIAMPSAHGVRTPFLLTPVHSFIHSFHSFISFIHSSVWNDWNETRCMFQRLCSATSDAHVAADMQVSSIKLFFVFQPLPLVRNGSSATPHPVPQQFKAEKKGGWTWSHSALKKWGEGSRKIHFAPGWRSGLFSMLRHGLERDVMDWHGAERHETQECGRACIWNRNMCKNLKTL